METITRCCVLALALACASCAWLGKTRVEAVDESTLLRAESRTIGMRQNEQIGSDNLCVVPLDHARVIVVRRSRQNWRILEASVIRISDRKVLLQKTIAVHPLGRGGADSIDAVQAYHGRLVAFAGTNGEIVIWDLRADALRYVSGKLFDRRINKLTFSADGRLFVAHNELDVWDIETGVQLANVADVSMFEFTLSGTILVPRNDGFDELDRKTYQRVRHHAFAFHPDSGGVWDSPTQMCRLPDGRILEQAYSGEIRVWNFAKAKSSTTIKPDIVIPRAAREEDGTLSYTWNLNATYDADGYVIAAAGKDSTVRIWNLADGSANSTIDLRERSSASHEPRLVTFIPLPTHRLAIVRENGATAIWNIVTRSWTGEAAPLMKDYVRD